MANWLLSTLISHPLVKLLWLMCRIKFQWRSSVTAGVTRMFFAVLAMKGTCYVVWGWVRPRIHIYMPHMLHTNATAVEHQRKWSLLLNYSVVEPLTWYYHHLCSSLSASINLSLPIFPSSNLCPLSYVSKHISSCLGCVSKMLTKLKW